MFRDFFVNSFCEENRKSIGEDVAIGVCKWCGCKFVKSSHRSVYCSDECRDDARAEQSRIKSHRWYHKHKHELSEKSRWGLGSGCLGGHRNSDFDKELLIVERELSRLNLRR